MSLIDGQGTGTTGSGMKDAQGNAIPLWNYSNATDKDGNARADYAQSIQGTVVDLKEVQSTKFKSDELEWWDKAQTQPKMDIEIAIATPNKGELVWHIKPGSLRKYEKFSLARRAIIDAIRAYTSDANTNDMTKLLGLDVTISTQDMVTQDGKIIPYGSANPRPWTVTINGEGDKTLVRYGKAQSTVKPSTEEVLENAGAKVVEETTAVQAAKEAQAAAEESDDIPFN